MSKAWGHGFHKGDREGRAIARIAHKNDMAKIVGNAEEIDGMLVGQCPFHSGYDGLPAFSRSCLFVYDPIRDVASCDCGQTCNACGLGKHIERVNDTIEWRRVTFDSDSAFVELLAALGDIA